MAGVAFFDNFIGWEGVRWWRFSDLLLVHWCAGDGSGFYWFAGLGFVVWFGFLMGIGLLIGYVGWVCLADILVEELGAFC